MANRIANPQYGVVAGRYLYRKTKKERMTLKTKFPCVAVLRDEDSLLKDLGYSYELRTKKLVVVALRGNQDPPMYLNCNVGGYPHDGKHYANYDVVGYPVRDSRTGEYVRIGNWDVSLREWLVTTWRKIWKPKN